VIVLTRRRFLGTSAQALALAAIWAEAFPLDPARVSAAPLQVAPTFPRSPFTLGVASGDPADGSVVLWTRLALDPLAEGGGLPPEAYRVTWELAEDERFSKVRGRDTVETGPERAHSVHVEVDGLRPERPYWYRFRIGSWESPVGRTRTAPRASADLDRLRLGFVSCQHWEQGYYTAHRHLAQEDLDVVLHLGDYIYEYGPQPNPVRVSVGPECTTLAGYRQRYAQYKSDPDLQAVHAAHPFIVTWDDHEVENDYASDHSNDGEPADSFVRRRAAAYQAYYEHMPLRVERRPRGPDMPLFRGIPYGRLVDLAVLDTRQYRTPQPCGNKPGPLCEGAFAPGATILGESQRRWLFERLDRSPARWHVLAQQVMMAPLDLAAGPPEEFSMDKWTAYQPDVEALFQFLATRRPSNPIVLSGDIHSSWACDLKAKPHEAASPVLGSEFVGTSISSGRDGTDISPRNQVVLAENPHVKFHNGQRGYVRCTVTRDRWHTDYRVVPFVSRPGASVETRASLVVENGRPGVTRA
jgi:alkaline phosphatase D